MTEEQLGSPAVEAEVNKAISPEEAGHRAKSLVDRAYMIGVENLGLGPENESLALDTRPGGLSLEHTVHSAQRGADITRVERRDNQEVRIEKRLEADGIQKVLNVQVSSEHYDGRFSTVDTETREQVGSSLTLTDEHATRVVSAVLSDLERIVDDLEFQRGAGLDAQVDNILGPTEHGQTPPPTEL